MASGRDGCDEDGQIQREEDVMWVRIRRKLAGIEAKMDKLLETAPAKMDDMLLETAAPDAAGRKREKKSGKGTLKPEELATLRRVASLPLEQRSHQDISAVMHVLRGSEVLLRLDEVSAAAFVGGLSWEDYAAGMPVVSEAVDGDSYLILVQGVLGVGVRRPPEQHAHRRVGNIYAGESFCEASFGETHAQLLAEARANVPANVLRVTRRQFHSAMRNWQAIQQERNITVERAFTQAITLHARALRTRVAHSQHAPARP